MSFSLGIIGYGGMGEWHHKNTAKVTGVQVVAAYDIDPARVQLFMENASQLPHSKDARGYNTLEDFLDDGRIKWVLVATPNHTHKDLCLKAIGAKKNVICEKPVMLNTQQLDEVLEAARKNNVIFTVHQNRRWDMDYVTVRESVQRGLLGKVFSIHSSLAGSGGEIHGWRALKECGGGMIYDWGVHITDQILDMVKDPIDTIYCITDFIKNKEVDDYFKAIIRFKTGIVAQIEVGTFCVADVNRSWQVYGDRGGVSLRNWECEGSVIVIKDEKHEFGSYIAESKAGPTRTFAIRASERAEKLPLPEVHPKWTDYYENLVQVDAGKADIIVKPKQVRRVMRVLDAYFQSASTGEVIRFEEEDL